MREPLKLEDAVAELKVISDQLVYYNYPLADPQLDNHLSVLKTLKVAVDGQFIFVKLSRSDFKDHVLESVQIYADRKPFLPFALVVKVGRSFLGSSFLSLVEVYRENQKIYIWNVASDKKGHPVKTPVEDGEPMKFEGFEYTLLDQSQVSII